MLCSAVVVVAVTAAGRHLQWSSHQRHTRKRAQTRLGTHCCIVRRRGVVRHSAGCVVGLIHRLEPVAEGAFDFTNLVIGWRNVDDNVVVERQSVA